MTASEPFTAAAAYQCDDVFRLLVDSWVSERRCPVPLCDRCMELDLPAAAECARWAATEPDREVATPCEEKGEVGTRCGLYPTAVSRGWFWYTHRHFHSPELLAADVYERNIGTKAMDPNDPGACLKHPTPLAAILWLLSSWVIA